MKSPQEDISEVQSAGVQSSCSTQYLTYTQIHIYTYIHIYICIYVLVHICIKMASEFMSPAQASLRSCTGCSGTGSCTGGSVH